MQQLDVYHVDLTLKQLVREPKPGESPQHETLTYYMQMVTNEIFGSFKRPLKTAVREGDSLVMQNSGFTVLNYKNLQKLLDELIVLLPSAELTGLYEHGISVSAHSDGKSQNL